MHVCHFCDTSLQGDYFRSIAKGLSQSGIKVTLLELGSGNPPDWLSTMPGVTFYSLNSNRKLHFPLAARRLATLLREQNVDILHTHLFYAGLLGVLVKRIYKRPLVALMRHHTGVVRLLGSRIHIAADKWMAEQADHLMTVSQAARRYMREVDGIRRDDIEVVHLGFDFVKYAPDTVGRERIRSEFGFGGEDFVIGYVGALVPGKGHVQLIKAFSLVTEMVPNAKLLFVGGGMLLEVEEALAELPAGKVVFAGWRGDVSACLNAMDLFVQPSLSEAFSQVLIEAMGCGLPVVATDVGGANEVIESGVNGILVPSDDADAIAASVTKIHREHDQSRVMANCGMRSVRERFNVEQMVGHHIELYERWTAS